MRSSAGDDPNQHNDDMMIRIGISKAHGSEKYLNYERWLRRSADDAEYVDLMQAEDLASALDGIDGLLLTGGSDIDPSRYDHPEFADQCADVDPERDEREFHMLERALERDVPVLAICRGLQVVNVQQGGTLIPHLPDRLGGSNRHNKDEQGEDRRHDVLLRPGSMLFKATSELRGEVNSNHHQAVDQVAPTLVATANAEDGTVEALEWLDPMGKSYLLAVEWHPERDFPNSPFSVGVREQFLFEVRSYAALGHGLQVRSDVDEESSDSESDGGTDGAH